MKEMSRRRFLQVAGVTVVAAALPALGGGRNHQGLKRIKVRSLSAPHDFSAAEKVFSGRAKFAAAADAMRAVAARRMRAELIAI